MDNTKVDNTKVIMMKRRVQRETVSAEVAARMIGCDKKLVTKLIELGYIKTLKLGAVKIPRYELDKFIRVSTDQEIDWNEILEGTGAFDWDGAIAKYDLEHSNPLATQAPIPVKPQMSVYHAFPQEAQS